MTLDSTIKSCNYCLHIGVCKTYDGELIKRYSSASKSFDIITEIDNLKKELSKDCKSYLNNLETKLS